MAKAKYSLEFRIAVIEYYLSGKGRATRTAAHFGIHKTTVSHWAASWQIHGIDEIARKVGCYSLDFKLRVVQATFREHLSCREAAVRFNISDNKVVKRWLDVYENSGTDGLQERKRGNVRNMNKINKKKCPPDTSTSPPVEKLSHEELLSELRYLRAENNYLKKLETLVQQKKKH